jgi:hypothetical protein
MPLPITSLLAMALAMMAQGKPVVRAMECIAVLPEFDS